MRLNLGLGGLAAALAVGGCAPGAPNIEPRIPAEFATESALTPRAVAFLETAGGRDVGYVQFVQHGHGTGVEARIDGLPPGGHGLHIHEVGQCRPDFGAAGGHYNPDGRDHGFKSPGGPHAGDLPNLHIPPEGSLQANWVLTGVGVGDLLAGNGTAVVVHRDSDDYRTDPAGDSGARIACGVVRRTFSW